jgi:hypothetical protein
VRVAWSTTIAGSPTTANGKPSRPILVVRFAWPATIASEFTGSSGFTPNAVVSSDALSPAAAMPSIVTPLNV